MKLVGSSYGKEDAKEVLCGLINDKIQFLGKQIFSHSERLGSDTKHLEMRQAELKSELKALISQISEMHEDEVVEIDCTINLKVKSVAL